MNGPDEEWREVEALLDALLELPPAERAAFLARADASPAARSAAERLLRREQAAEAFLVEPAAAYAASLVARTLEADDAAAAPRRIGPFRVVREIGHGGMGTVYLGERDDGEFEQRVAIKLVRGGAADAALGRRFREERQILARLEHPHIARLLDGGVTADGVPWLAMEYVEGQPIDRYCDEHGLDLDERLRLFCAVCGAVDYAHRRLIVHRDLKPSNILVAEPEPGAAAEPKLLDFGIAKLLDPVAADPLDHTRTAGQMLTPEYASPEQLRGEPAATTSDVYSLGVLLYRLLTGGLPYTVETGAPPHELARAILETTPPAPSAATHGAAARGAARPPAADRWRGRLRGDLDAIVLMALRKEPERRYASADRLAADVRRVLGGQPVEARPDTRRYRAGKFLRRHRTAAALIAAATLAAVSATAFHTVEVTRERDLAQREAAKAEQVTAFLVDLFESSDPFSDGAGTLSLTDYLHRGAERLDRELVDQPDLRATLLTAIGDVYTNLGRYDDAGSLYERAHEIRRARVPPDHPDLAASLAGLGVIRHRKGDYAAADSLLGAALALRRARFGDRHLAVAAGLQGLATLRFEQQEFAAADSLHRDVLALRRELLGAEHPAVAATLNDLATTARGRGDYAGAEAYHREALAIRRSHFGDEHPWVAVSAKNLALALHSQRRLEEAEPLYREALDLQTRLLGPDHPERGSTLQSLASLLQMMGDYPGAEPLFREALELQRRTLGPSHPRTATTLTNLAGLLRDRGELSEAERLARESLEIRRQTLAPDHPSVAISLSTLGSVRRDQGRVRDARPLMDEAASILESRLGERHPFTGLLRHGQASVAHRLGEHRAAEALYRTAIDVVLADTTGSVVEAARSMVALGELLVADGRAAEAERWAQQALRLRLDHLPASHWRIAEARVALGLVLAALGRNDEAAGLLRQGLSGLEGIEGIDQRRARRLAIERLAAIGS